MCMCVCMCVCACVARDSNMTWGGQVGACGRAGEDVHAVRAAGSSGGCGGSGVPRTDGPGQPRLCVLRLLWPCRVLMRVAWCLPAGAGRVCSARACSGRVQQTASLGSPASHVLQPHASNAPQGNLPRPVAAAGRAGRGEGGHPSRACAGALWGAAQAFGAQAAHRRN